ncbi:ShlB/FhaC/HecB family hemolysin secretion/activation protein [Pseudomonas mediterranea]|uniref:ShlB/FhaC/HecB family hemolysin secretion/activation protein n=1 Tax=Pseudomonas mediterranea TaxID=183795 RepID=UPI003BF57957
MCWTFRFLLSSLSVALTLATAQAVAATPDAGQILQEPREPMVAPTSEAPALTIDKPRFGSVPEGGARLRLTAVRFSGNTAFSAEVLQGVVTDAVGKELTFADLSRLTDRVSRYYRDAGYLVARAYLPAQEVKNGELEIALLEGNLGQVTVTNTAGLKDSALAPVQALPLNAPVQESSLDRALLTLSDLPGTRVQSTLRPGSTLGASDLLVEVQKTRSVQGSADVDNFGSTYTGEYRAGTSLYWNNPLDRGDQLSLRLQTSDADMHYERLGYQLPMGNYGTRVGVAVSHIDYRLGKNFESLDADGTANTASLYLRQPLLRSPTSNWYGQLQLDAKNLRDTVGITSTVTEQRLRNAVLGINGDWQDQLLGSNSLGVNLTTGRLQLDDDSQAQDAASARSAGHFNKLAYQMQRVQALLPNWSLAFNFRGQKADENLSSAEKFSLGGSDGVRAFAQGEAIGDEGWLANLALRWQPVPGWQLQTFYDAGTVAINHRRWTSDDNRTHLGGAGLGLGWGTEKLAFSLTSAWATEGKDSADQHGARLWAQAAIGF